MPNWIAYVSVCLVLAACAETGGSLLRRRERRFVSAG